VHPSKGLLLSSIELKADSVSLADDKPVSTIQVAKLGFFKSSRYGKFSITEKHVDEIIANHAKLGTPPPIDYHHLSIGAKTPDQAIAAGWFKSLEKRDDKTLWGTVEWTPKAAKHIQDGEFKYISPYIFYDAQSESGEQLGTVMASAALTNYPFLKGMAAVELSELQAQGIVLADLSVDQQRLRISDALHTYYKNSGQYTWIRDVFDDYVVYELDSKLYKLGYSVNGKFEVTFTGDPEEVVPQYVSLSADGGKKKMSEDPKPNADVVKLQSDFAALQAQFVESNTKFTETNAKVVALSTELTAEKEENKKLRDELNKNRADAQVTTLLRAGKIVPKQKDSLIKLALSDPLLFEEMTKDMPVVVKLNAQHGTNDGDENAAQFTNDSDGDPIKLFDDKVAAYQKENKDADINKAIAAVDKENPGLYEKRRLAYASKTAVGDGGSVQ
jgi:phage I-like protein